MDVLVHGCFKPESGVIGQCGCPFEPTVVYVSLSSIRVTSITSADLYPGFDLQACSTSTPLTADAPCTAGGARETPLARCSANKQDAAV